MVRLVTLLFILTAIASAQLIDDDVMPFGGYSHGSAEFFTDSLLDYMHDSLGINQHTGGEFDTALVGRFYQEEIYPYPWGSFWLGGGQWEIEPQTKFAGANYFKCQPESSSYYNVKFKGMSLDQGYPNPGSTFVAYSGSGMMLDTLRFYLPNRYDWLINVQLKFYPSFRIKIDTSGFSNEPEDTLVGVFMAEKIWPYPNGTFGIEDTLCIDSIWFSALSDSNGLYADFIELSLTNDLDSNREYFNTCDESQGDSSGAWTKFSLETVGHGTIFIDYFKIHCQYGHLLVDSSYYDELIKESVGRAGFEGRILGWFLKDTQNANNFRTFAYIDSLIDDTTTAGWQNPVRGATWLIPRSGSGRGCDGDSYRDFVRIVRPSLLWSYMYPIDWETKYTGFDDSELQFDLNYYIVIPCDSIRTVLADTVSNSTEGWLFTPQYWYNGPDYPDAYEKRREPTAAELRCETYIGMCYHPKSIMFWLVYGSNAPPGPVGLLTTDSLTRIGKVVRDDINPYIKAIDSTYLELAWDSAYYISPTQGPPAGRLISSITAASNLPDSNPDLSWFQVGEYHDPNELEPYGKYFMLVNRACSKDENGNEAPSVTAIVELNRVMFNNPTQVFVVDLAESVYYDDEADVWVSVPETTYTTLTSDSKLHYTTVLKAGEGRLFTVLQADTIDLTGDFDTTYYYQGGYSFDSTLTIPSNKTLRLKGPSKLTFASNDTMIIEGGLITTGCDSGLVTFAAEDTSTQWRGLFFTDSTATGNLGNINIENTYYHSIKITDKAFVELKNSIIKDSQYGVHLVNSGKLKARDCSFDDGSYGADGIYNESGDSLDISNCTFTGFCTSGILAYDGYLKVDSCNFDSITLYGIYTDSSEADISNCNFTNIDDYGIKIIEGDVSMTNCYFHVIDDYGIYVSNGDIEISDCEFDDLEYYGIRADSADVKITSSEFAVIDIYGVYLYRSKSDIADCDFDRCFKYGIYVDEDPTDTNDSVIVNDCYIKITQTQDPDSSQYGIRVDGADKVRIEGNTIRQYKQGGIYLNDSDGKIIGDTISSSTNYGIYVNNSDEPYFEDCWFDTLETGINFAQTSYCKSKVRWCKFGGGTDIGVKHYSLGLDPTVPDLGVEEKADSGMNDFRYCREYYIYHQHSSNPQPEEPPVDIMAQYNWFGEEPDPEMFTAGVVYEPWLEEEPPRGKIVVFEVPLTYQLNANYPNPFNPNTTIKYSLAEPGYTTISIYNILGQRISTIVNEHKQAGHYAVTWDGKNRYGKPVSSGIYFYRIESGEFINTKKMLLLR